MNMKQTPPSPSDRVERILNMDEETFRTLFNMRKVEKEYLRGSGYQETDEVDRTTT